jgi:pimeloyl-[acyl-carrier protein] methyl ester esterase
MTLSINSSGHGPDIVLIHGWAMHSGIFAPLSERLASRFRVHLVDLPGHGASRDYAHGDLDPRRLAQRIVSATPPALWLGWSLGGLCALRGALDHPQHVRGVIEIASSPRFVSDEGWTSAVEPEVFREFGRGLEQNFHLAIERFLALETLGSPNAQEQLRALRNEVFARGEPAREALYEGLDILDACDLRAALAGISRPSLWIAGRRDRLVPSAAMQWAAQQAKGQFVELSAGHAPFISHPAEVAEAIEAFSETVAT